VGLGSFNIGGLLCGIHAMAAQILKTPELELDKDEGQKLGDAVQEVAKQYNHVINPKTAAWIQLCVVSGGIYGIRIAAIRIRETRERKIKVVPLNGFPESKFTAPVPPERDGGFN
jgi:hypothetical protein